MYSQNITSKQVVGALEAHGCKPKRSGAGWKSKCPAHDGKTQSLSVDDGDTGNAVVYCFSGCDYRAVMRALGLDQAASAKRQIVSVYDYDGHFETVRYDPKGFAQRRKLASGEYAWNLKGTPTRLYRQADLMESKPAEVFVVEGEKDVETLRSHEVLAVTNHGGAGKWRAAHTAALVAAGIKAVVVVPDNDEPGHEHANKVAAGCKTAGLAVKVLELPAHDASLYMAANNRASLLALAADAATWAPPAVKADAVAKRDTTGEVSEHSVALDFTERYRDTMRYSPDVASWYEWDETRWRPDRLARAFHYARELAGESSESTTARKASFARGVEAFCRADPAHSVEASYWDSDGMFLGTPSGSLDLATGRVLPASPTHRITKLTAVGPGKSGECPRWLQFLDESTGSDNQLIAFLQRWAGYCLTGSTKEQALVFVYGPGGTGKSVFLSVLSGIMGNYSTTAAMDVLTASQYDRHSTEIAQLAGARLVTASETDEGRSWDEAKVKTLTGSDRISARFMRQNLFEFQPAFKLMLSGNSLPNLRDCGAAMRRRFRVVPFDKTPEQPDLDLSDKLRQEWPSILAWAVEGCSLWQRDGLGTAAAIETETNQYFAESDHFGAWLESCCELCEQSEGYELATALYGSWDAYLKRAHEPPESTTRFGRRLRAHGLHKEKFGTVRWHGIRLAADTWH